MKRMRKKWGAFLLVVVLGLSISAWSRFFMGTFSHQTESIVINDNNQVLTIDCNGADVTVNGNHNTITLLGTCSSLLVHGNKNQITLESPTDVTDTGNNNTITIQESSAPATPTPTDTPKSSTNTPQVPTDTPQIPTNTPQVPTDTPQIPTDTPRVPTDTPQIPSATPQVPTSTPQIPTDTPQVPTNTPQIPSATPQIPTSTPQIPTDTPQVPTNTPQPATETPVVDNESPTVRWIAPVQEEERYDVSEGEQVLLEAEASDNVGVAMVRFVWWDAVNEQYVTLGTLTQPPYRLQINASDLNPEWNQVFVNALDQAQNSSDFPYIWLYKLVQPGNKAVSQIFLPIIGK